MIKEIPCSVSTEKVLASVIRDYQEVIRIDFLEKNRTITEKKGWS